MEAVADAQALAAPAAASGEPKKLGAALAHRSGATRGSLGT